MKNALILGATSDMAVAIAHKYAAEGWGLTLAGLESDVLESMVQDLQVRSGARIESVEFDASDYAKHRSFYESLSVKPDVVICAFGYLCDNIASRTNFEEARRAIEVNFIGAASVLGIVAHEFERRRKGVIIGISSVAGERGRQGGYVYASTKAGLTAYLSGLRNRLAKSGVHVMTVMAGFCRTKMTEDVPFPNILSSQPEQVADAVFMGHAKKKDIIYTLPVWRWIMMVIRYIPEPVFKRIGYTRLRY